MPPTEAEVLHLPTKWVQSCYSCVNAAFGERGTYCHVFGETILSEKLAGQDCDSFESSDGQAYARLESR